MKRCCIGTIISLLVVIVLIAAAVIVVLNLTPAQLHIDNISLGGNTLADYGLSDVKFIQIIKSVRSLKQNESDIVDNGYSEEEEEALSAGVFSYSTNFATADGYGLLLTETVLFDNRYVVVLNDTTLAYIFDKVLADTYVYTVGDSVEKPTMSVRELTVTKTESGAGHMRIVVGVDTTGYIPDVVEEAVSKTSAKMPEYIYVVFEGDFNVVSTGDGQGRMMFTSVDANINGDKSNALNGVLIDVMAKAIGESAESAEATKQAFCNAVFDKVAATINHIGSIGSALADANGRVVGEVTYGMSGVLEHKLSLVTATSAH